MEKRVRVRIGSQYPELLPMGGLTRPEWAARQRMSKLSLAQKQAMSERGAAALRAMRTKKGEKGE